MNFSSQPVTIPVWRMIDPRRHEQPFSGEGARRYGGRWNMRGWPALYLSAEPATAVTEYYRSVLRPGTLVPFHLDATLVRLADDAGGPADDRVALGLAADWKTIAGIDGEVPPSWALAQELIAIGAQGALVPSTQNPGGTNVVLWRWHDARVGGEGAALTLLDPEAALTR